jgi:hypothetical protein
MVEVRERPDARLREGLDQVSPAQQHDLHGELVAVAVLDAAHSVVELMVEVIEHLDRVNKMRPREMPRKRTYMGGWLVLALQSLPVIDHDEL